MKDFILDGARERITSLKKELTRLKDKEYPSKANSLLLDIIEDTIDFIDRLLSSAAKDESLSYLDEDRINVRLTRLTKLVPCLYLYFSLVEASDFDDSPIELINPLRRLIKRYIDNSDVIITTKHEFNYGVLNVSEHYRKTWVKSHFSHQLC